MRIEGPVRTESLRLWYLKFGGFTLNWGLVMIYFAVF